MNAFDYIKELKETINTLRNNTEPHRNFTAKEHFDFIDNMLNLLEKEMHNAEYSYRFESAHIRGINNYISNNDFVVTETELTNDIIIFQPVAEEYTYADMDSLANITRELKDNGKIKEDILILPPGINVIKAVLKLSDETIISDKATMED